MATFVQCDFSTFQEFLITGQGNRLSSKTVIRLTSICPNLRWIGDLRDWKITSRDRNVVLPSLLGNEGWEYSRMEPKEEMGKTFSHEENNQHHVNWLTISNSYDILTKKIEE